MIYIFDVLCKAPCKCCKEACKAWADVWAPITRNPLGGYVIMTWITMIPVVVCAGVSLTKIVCKDPKLHLFLAIGTALIHALGAWHIQHQLVKALNDAGMEERAQMTHHAIAKKAGYVMVYDIGFCLYTFFFLGAFGFACYSLQSLQDCEGEGTGLARCAWGLLIFYAMAACNFATCWYCGQQCCKESPTVRAKKARKGCDAEPGTVGPETVGGV